MTSTFSSLRSQQTVTAVERRPARGMQPHTRSAPTTGDVLVSARPPDDPPGADTDRVAIPGVGPLDPVAEHECPSFPRVRLEHAVDPDALTVPNEGAVGQYVVVDADGVGDRRSRPRPDQCDLTGL